MITPTSLSCSDSLPSTATYWSDQRRNNRTRTHRIWIPPLIFLFLCILLIIMISANTLQVGLRLVLLFVADTSFVLASIPPHKADSAEIQKDKQALADYTISRIPLLAGPLIYALTISQLWIYWDRNESLGTRWDSWEVLGALGMISGGQLRLWCYRVLGRFFTFNVSDQPIIDLPRSQSIANDIACNQKGELLMPRCALLIAI